MRPTYKYALVAGDILIYRKSRTDKFTKEELENMIGKFAIHRTFVDNIIRFKKEMMCISSLQTNEIIYIDKCLLPATFDNL
jgi:hypothetical protein